MLLTTYLLLTPDYLLLTPYYLLLITYYLLLTTDYLLLTTYLTTCIVHVGADDCTVPTHQAVRLHAALSRAGALTELSIGAGVGHTAVGQLDTGNTLQVPLLLTTHYLLLTTHYLVVSS